MSRDARGHASVIRRVLAALRGDDDARAKEASTKLWAWLNKPNKNTVRTKNIVQHYKLADADACELLLRVYTNACLVCDENASDDEGTDAAHDAPLCRRHKKRSRRFMKLDDAAKLLKTTRYLLEKDITPYEVNGKRWKNAAKVYIRPLIERTDPNRLERRANQDDEPKKRKRQSLGRLAKRVKRLERVVLDQHEQLMAQADAHHVELLKTIKAQHAQIENPED